MEDMYDFFSSSTKRHEVLSKYMEDVANALKLRNLSKTRWTARAESIQAVWISYEAIVEALEEILTKPVDAKTRVHASGLLKKIKQLDFIASIMFMKNVMLKTSKLAEALQAEELNILDALKNTRSTISVLKRFKASESEMNDQIKASCKFAEKIGIDPEEDFKKHHRKRRKPARADDNPNTQVDLTMPQHFRKEFKSVLDTFINMFEDKIAPTLDTVLPMVRVLQPPFKDTIPNDDDVVALCNMFVTEKDPGAVSVELELFRDRTSDETITNTAEAIKLAIDNRSSLPQLWECYKLLLTTPISVAKDERTFSVLKLVKNFYRSTMEDTRLDDLMVLRCEKDLTDTIKLEDVLDEWSMKPRR